MAAVAHIAGVAPATKPGFRPAATRAARRAGASTASWLIATSPTIVSGRNTQENRGTLKLVTSQALTPTASTAPSRTPMTVNNRFSAMK